MKGKQKQALRWDTLLKLFRFVQVANRQDSLHNWKRAITVAVSQTVRNLFAAATQTVTNLPAAVQQYQPSFSLEPRHKHKRIRPGNHQNSEIPQKHSQASSA